jgi:hypothetical protein
MADLEIAKFRFGWFPFYVDAEYHGAFWSFSAEIDHRVYCFLLPLEDGFDSAVA